MLEWMGEGWLVWWSEVAMLDFGASRVGRFDARPEQGGTLNPILQDQAQIDGSASKSISIPNIEYDILSDLNASSILHSDSEPDSHDHLIMATQWMK